MLGVGVGVGVGMANDDCRGSRSQLSHRGTKSSITDIF